MTHHLTPREEQFLFSMIEEVYTTENYPSFAYTVVCECERVQNETDPSMFNHFKQKVKQPTGQMSLTVTVQIYNYFTRTDYSMIELIEAVAEVFDYSPRELSDDMLVRGLSKI